MVISRDNTADLQRILDILQINPSLISVDTVQSLGANGEEDEEDEEDSCESDDESPDEVQPDKGENDENGLRSRKRKIDESGESEDTKRQK